MKTNTVEQHFAKYSGQYYKNVHMSLRLLYQNIGVSISEQLKGSVLDIGNGGVFFYNTEPLEKITAVDIAYPHQMMNTEKISFITGDARDLHFLADETYDCILMQFLLHHIVESTRQQTEDVLLSIFQESFRLLKRGGKIVIIESIVNSFVEVWENLFYTFHASILHALNRPMVKFYSLKSLTELLKRSRFAEVQIQKIPIGNKWIPLAPALFPGILKVPPYLFPTRFYRIVSTKPE